MRSRSWRVLIVGFGALLILMGLYGIIAARRAQRIYAVTQSAYENHRHAQQALAELRSGIYLAGLCLRDYLLDPSNLRADRYREQFVEVRASTMQYANQLRRPTRPEDTLALERLEGELEAYFGLLAQVFEWTPQRKILLSSRFLREQVLPRRKSVLAMALEVRDLNRVHFARQREELARLAKTFAARGVYHKILTRQVRRAAPAEASPQLVLGEAAPERFTVRENGVQFELSFAEGYSVGLFLDQRDNRRRLLTGHVAAGFSLLPSSLQSPITDRRLQILNTFAYTCGFSVCAAKTGARTTSLDLSKKCLDWGKRNFAVNQLDPAAHDFIYGDVFDWLRRLARKQRLYDVILLDPPTFSQSKESGVFRADKDYGRLVMAALPLLRTGGVLFASTNAADWPPEEFLAAVTEAIHRANRKILQQHYVPQPPDFPVTRAEPAYLKTVWLRVE